MLTIGDIYF